MRRAFLIVPVVGLLACTAILGIDKDYQQGTIEAGIESGADAGDSGDEGALDAGFEGSPCEQMHTFCDDFDKNGLGIGWTGTYPGSLAKMGIDTLGYVSAPKSLSCETVSSTDASANDPNTDSKLVRLVLGKYNQLSADVDIRIEQASSDPNLTVELMGVSMIAQSGNPNWHVVLHHYSSKLQVVEEHFGYPDGGYDFLYNDIPQQFTIGQWSHVHIEVATTGAKTHAKVTIGGGVVFDQDLVEVWPLDTRAELTIGTFALWWGADHWKVRYDNAVFDVQ